MIIDPKEVKQGWYIARTIHANGPGSWAFVWVKGRAPFLTVWPAVLGLDSMDWSNNDRYLSRGIPINEHTEWEFAKRIDLPVEVTT